MSIFEDMPQEIFVYIFRYLNLSSLKQCMLVSRFWRNISCTLLGSQRIILRPNDWEEKCESNIICYFGSVLLYGFTINNKNDEKLNPFRVLNYISDCDYLSLKNVEYTESYFYMKIIIAKELILQWTDSFYPEHGCFNAMFEIILKKKKYQIRKVVVFERSSDNELLTFTNGTEYFILVVIVT